MLSFVSLLVGVANAADHKYLKAFPKPAKGMVRYVIELPHKNRGEENAFKVELIVGKMLLTDGVNRMFMGGKLETKPLKGWGFTYYEVAKLGPAASTLIGVPPGTPKVEKFVAGPSQLIRYNSRIPIVVYVPKGGEVHYRIWAAKPENMIAPSK
jgi:ecotin